MKKDISTWKKIKCRVKDVPAQMGLDGKFITEPDSAAHLAAQSLDCPERESNPIPVIHRVISTDGTAVHWEDERGKVVGYGEANPYVTKGSRK